MVVITVNGTGSGTAYKLLRPPGKAVDVKFKYLQSLELERTCSIRFYALVPIGPKYPYKVQRDYEGNAKIMEKEQSILNLTTPEAANWARNTFDIPGIRLALSYLQAPRYVAYETN